MANEEAEALGVDEASLERRIEPIVHKHNKCEIKRRVVNTG